MEKSIQFYFVADIVNNLFFFLRILLQNAYRIMTKIVNRLKSHENIVVDIRNFHPSLKELC